MKFLLLNVMPNQNFNFYYFEFSKINKNDKILNFKSIKILNFKNTKLKFVIFKKL